MINKSIQHLRNLQTTSNLFRASPEIKTGYNRIWIRDNLYISIAFEEINDKKTVENIFISLLNLLVKYEYKIDNAIKEKPTEDYKYIHPVYTENLEETKGGWGWKQNDAIGGLLFKIGKLEQKNYNIIRNDKHFYMLKKLVLYLKSIEYWKDKDNGMWEENKEIHSSSIGACIAGLKAISHIVEVPIDLIKKGEQTLARLLPAESMTKPTDLSLLSLIYPYKLLNKEQSEEILENIEKYLCKEKGIIRYVGDSYYKENNKEASWTMGFPWMAICYYQIGNLKKYKYYIKKTIEVLNDNLELTELYKEDKYPNENTPLGWSQSLLIKALNI